MADQQLTLLQDDAVTAGAALAKLVVDAIMAGKVVATTRSEPFTNRDMMRLATPICERALADRALATHHTGPKQRRELLFSALCRACKINEAELTRPASRTIAVAVSQIKEASPAVTPEEIERRAHAYAKKYPGAALTPSAINSHWGSLSNGHLPAKPDVYAEPAGWKESEAARRAVYGGVDNEAWLEIVRRGWFDLGTTERMQILLAMK